MSDSDQQCPYCPRNGFANAHGLQVHIARAHQDVAPPSARAQAGRRATGKPRPAPEGKPAQPVLAATEHDDGVRYVEQPIIMAETTSAKLELLCHVTQRNPAEIMRDHVETEFERLDLAEHFAREHQLAEIAARG